MPDDAIFKPVADAIETASVEWRRQRNCVNPPGCGRDDCRSHTGQWPAMCRGYAEFMAVAAVEALRDEADRRRARPVYSDDACPECRNYTVLLAAGCATCGFQP